MPTPTEPNQPWSPLLFLEYQALWFAVELTLTEISQHFGHSRRHLLRRGKELSLGPRRRIRRLNDSARTRLLAIESLAEVMSGGARTLLKVAQARRAQEDEKRLRARQVAARRVWRRRTSSIPPGWLGH